MQKENPFNTVSEELSPQEFKAFFNAVLDYPGDIMSFSVNKEFRYVSFNQNYKNYLKQVFKIDLKPGDSLLNVFDGFNDLRKERKNFDRAFEGTEFSQIGQYTLKNKTLFYKDIYKPVFDENGEVIGVTVFYTNITQRKQSERAWEIIANISERVNSGGSFEEFLQFIRKELGKIINTTNFFVALYNEENQRYSFPYYADRHDDLERYRFYDLSKSSTDYVRRTGKPLLMTTEKKQELEESNTIRIFGTPSPSWMGIPLKTGNRTIGVMVVQDYDRQNAYTTKDLELMASVSDYIASSVEKKRTERILDETTKKLQYAQAIAKLGHLEFDMQTKRLHISGGAANLLGLDQHEIRTIADLLPFINEKDRTLLNEIEEKLSEKKNRVYEADFRFQNPARNEIQYFNTKSEYIYNQTGEPSKVSIIIQDVTEQQKDKLELKRAKEKAEESDKLKSAFLANMSHEIRTPMNAILGFSKLLADPDITTETREKYAGYVNNGAQNLLKLINDILDIAKIEAGQLSVKIKVVDIHAETEELLEEYKQQRRELKKEHIELKLINGSSEKEFLINTDQLRIRQILTNLVGNALKFIDKGSIEFGYTQPNDYNLEFFVKDTGNGIPEDKKDLIFSRFGQVIDDEIKHPGGTGLGLSITKHLVERLGGTVRLESELGKGTSFYFTIPYEKGDKLNLKPKAAEQKVDMETLKNLSILVVEDNKVNQILVQDIVSRWTPENEICFADNGTQALERFHQKRFDIIFMDIKLPDKDGFELTTYLRNIHSPNIETPVVGLSAHAMKEYIEKSLRVGMNDFLTKPFAAKDFFAILAKHTGAAHKKITENKQGIDGFKHINLSILKPIYDAKPERMKQIISLYVENISSALENLKLFADTPADPEDVRKIAHNLKSSLRYLGMNEAGEIAYTIEKNPTENLAENLEQIKQFWKFAKAELESILF